MQILRKWYLGWIVCFDDSCTGNWKQFPISHQEQTSVHARTGLCLFSSAVTRRSHEMGENVRPR